MYFKDDNLFTPYEREKGIPIGNLTSQFFANVYLNGFDHFVKQKLGWKFYIRYVDDFVVLDNCKGRLWAVKEQMGEYLESLRLKLHERKSRVYRVQEGISFLGYRIFPDHRLLKKDNALHMRRKLKELSREYREGVVSLEEIQQIIQSWIGHASHADTYRLRERILGSVTFQRGGAGDAARRLLEQQSGERPLRQPQQQQPEQQEQQCGFSLRQDLDT